MALPVTSLYAGLLALMLVGLAVRVALRRRHYRIGIGTGDNADLARAVRVHGNAVEYIPIGVLLLALIEVQGGHAAGLHVAGAGLVLGRVFHAWGLAESEGVTWGRTGGMLLSWLSLIAMAIWLVLLGVALH